MRNTSRQRRQPGRRRPAPWSSARGAAPRSRWPRSPRGALGLTGPGAYAAARALMIGMLAASAAIGGPLARVIIPEAVFRQLTGEPGPPAAQVPGVSPGLADGLP